ncbi:hypothetical protein LSTR_LSTR008492 [Laodelphax striatellus]|uniref:Uncharacterized protein n=1 Tax=Laodelphax striatellus TaxID=195883 RepID=A0A482WRP0_LAOST|nr:hypothetical protein LSTR_LSTR008492 [Laodelphax striatellus]
MCSILPVQPPPAVAAVAAAVPVKHIVDLVMEGTKEAEQREDDQFLRWPLSSNSERKPRLLPHLDPSTFISLKRSARLKKARSVSVLVFHRVSAAGRESVTTFLVRFPVRARICDTAVLQSPKSNSVVTGAKKTRNCNRNTKKCQEMGKTSEKVKT